MNIKQILTSACLASAIGVGFYAYADQTVDTTGKLQQDATDYAIKDSVA